MLTTANICRKKLSTANAPIQHSKCVVAVGKPFMRGEDSRRHKLGRMSLGRAAFVARFNNSLAGIEGDPEDLARILWKYARAGRPWAVSEILDRICGRPKQTLEHSEAPSFKLSIKDFKESLRALKENENEGRS